MKRILSIILFCIFSLGTLQTYANEISQNDKQILPVLIVNNAYYPGEVTSKISSQLPPILINQVTKSLGVKYDIKQIDNTFNILDVASTEKNDLLDMFKGSNYSTVIIIEILPIRAGRITNLHEMHIKILDINNQKYLYNGKLWHERTAIRDALNDMNINLDKILKDVFKL